MVLKHVLPGVAAAVVAAVAGASAQAQVPYVTYYRPVTAYYVAPAPAYVTAMPVIQPAPVVQPAPVAVTAYYAPAPTVVYQPASRVVTRYRPLLGGTVTRVRPAGYVPVVYP